MEISTIETFVFQAQTKVSDIAEFVAKNTNNLSAHEMEKQLFIKMLEMGKIFMQEYFSQIQVNDVGLSISDMQGNEYKRYGNVFRHYFSIFGKMLVGRMSYWKKGEKTIYPLDNQCNMPERCYSYFVQEIMNSMSVNEAFGKCEQSMASLFNIDIHDKQFEDISQDSMADYQEFYEQNPAPCALTEGELQVMSADGVGVAMIKEEAAKIKPKLGKGEKKQTKKEALVCTSYTIDTQTRTAVQVAQNLIFPQTNEPAIKEKRQSKLPTTKPQPKAQNIRRIASIKQDKKQVVQQMLSDAQKRNKDKQRPYIVLIDGSLYLWKIIVSVLQGLNYVLVLDIIHVLEYLYTAAYTVHKENTHEARCYVYQMLKTILEGKVEVVIEQLKQLVKKDDLSESKKAAINRTIKYLTNHKELMHYDQYLDKGYPIATGVVESTCKSLVKERMDGSGMRWSLEGAEAMLLLRSVKHSKDAKKYAEFHAQKEKFRLYGSKEYVVNQQYKQAA